MVYKKGTPEYDRWKRTPAYALWCARISAAQRGKRNHNYGKDRTSEVRAKISAAHTGKRLSTETRAKISVSMTGERNPMYGKHHNAEACAKIRAAHMGKYPSAETRARQSAAKMGKQHSVEALAKMSVAHMGKQNPMYGKHHSVETLAKMSAAQTGERNPNWRGGVSFEPYPISWTEHLRETIRKRDNYICILCRKTQDKRRLEVHHIDYDKQNLCPENLISLCIGCHQKTNGNREYWKNLFEIVYVPDFPKERMMKNESRCG